MKLIISHLSEQFVADISLIVTSANIKYFLNSEKKSEFEQED